MNTLMILARRFSRSPLFSGISVLTLALGIGANAVMFSVVNGILLKPLPFDEPDALVGIWHTAPGLGFETVNQSPAMYFTYREEAESFEDMALWDNRQASVTGHDEPEEVEVLRVSDGTLPILRVKPILGRGFTMEDDQSGSAPTAILSHGYWQRRFGGRKTAIGESLRVDGTAREIIGVLPADFRFLRSDAELYLPFQFDRAEIKSGNFSHQGLARLKPGATLEQANAEIERLIPVSVANFPGGLSLQMLKEAKFAPKVRPFKEDAVGDVGGVLWVLLGTVVAVFLIACANVANLFLVRMEARQQELAVRTAMGANRGRLAREFLGESVSLGILGGLLGLAFAWGGVRLLVAIGPESLPRLHEIGMDPIVLAYTLGISVAAGLLFGLLPILKYAKPHLVSALKEGGRGANQGRERHRARNALVVSQIALALVLLIGAGLMLRSFSALREVNPGFLEPEKVLTTRIAIPTAEVEQPEEVARLYERMVRGVEAIAGVRSVGLASSVTMDGWDSNDGIYVEGFPTPEGQLPPIRRLKWVAANYAETMGNPLITGRTITWTDIHDRAPVVMVTADFASEYWESPAEALGKRLRQTAEDPWRTIVGVVGEVRDDGLEKDAVPVIFWPMLVRDFWDKETHAARTLVFAIRSERLTTPEFLAEVRSAIWAVNKNLPLANIRTLDQIVDRSMARTSFTLVMLLIAAVVALCLGVVGIYGVISYAVSQRTREIGVRMALGAARRDVSRMVLRQGLKLAAVGVAVGLAVASVATRVMATLLFGVSPLDPTTFGLVALGLSAVALLASYIPARRAASVAPTVALRWE